MAWGQVKNKADAQGSALEIATLSGVVTVATNYYRAVRDELVERVKLRDQVLLVYLGFVGAVLGASLTKDSWREIGLILPFLGLGCAILVSQHNAVIGALIRFINEDLKRKLKETGIDVPEFVSSNSFRGHSRYSNFSRSLGHAVVIMIPEIAGLGINFPHALLSPFPMGPAWWFGLAFALCSAFVIYDSHRGRSRVYNDTPWGS
jgi:hypothetical protein